MMARQTQRFGAVPKLMPALVFPCTRRCFGWRTLSWAMDSSLIHSSTSHEERCFLLDQFNRHASDGERAEYSRLTACERQSL
jgi:hypothetical protein